MILDNAGAFAVGAVIVFGSLFLGEWLLHGHRWLVALGITGMWAAVVGVFLFAVWATEEWS